MPDFSALHVAMSGLRAAQIAMDTASHNVANANTPGYTRQRVDMAANQPRFSAVGQIGTGVSVSDISRVRDNFLDVRYRSSVSAFANADARADLLARAERMLGEPELGVSAELSSLWDAFEDLALNPPDEASRIAVLEQLGALAGRVNHVAGGLQALRDDAVVDIQAEVDEVNQVLAEIAELNVSILDASAQAGAGQPNDLMDQRDVLLDRVAELVGATSTVESNGSVRVSIGGVTLVAGSNVRGLSYDTGSGQILHASGIEVVPGGAVRGLQSTISTDFVDLAARLDAFAADLADTVNAVHAGGYTSAGAAGGPLLSYNAANPALTLAVAISGPAELAAAAAPGPPYAEFDGTAFSALAALRTATSAGGTGSLGDVYRTFVTKLGQETAAARTSGSTQSGLVDAAGLARNSQHGVSVDEELVNLMEFQRMYEAAARVVTAVDQALDTVINRMGVVGR